MEHILKEVAQNEGFSDEVRIELVDGGPGEKSNFHGTLTRGRLVEGNRSLSVLVKTAPVDPLLREAKVVRLKYCNEINFYTKVRPVLSRFGSLPTIPRIFWSCLDEGKEALVLEDIGELGYQTASIKNGIDGTALEMVLLALEKLYSCSRYLKQKEPHTFDRLAASVQESFCIGPYFKMSAIKCVENARRVATEYLGTMFVDKIFQFNILGEMEAALRQSDNLVITHGDAWPSNILFKYDQMGAVIDVALVDWQLCRVGSPLLDTSYLLLTSAPHRPFPGSSRAGRFGLGMSFILLPFALGQADPSLVLTPERITFPRHSLADSRIAAAIRSAVLNEVI